MRNLSDMSRADPEFMNLFAGSDDQSSDPRLDVFTHYNGFDTCRPLLLEHLKSLGFVYTPNDDESLSSITIPSLEAYRELCDICSKISSEYDDPNPAYDYPAQPPTWARFGLGGDDDVDYNSSYFDPLLHIIGFYIEHKL
jgi:hypothetical protein